MELNKMSEKVQNEFLTCLAKLNPAEIFGLVRLLGLKAVKEDGTLKDGSEIIEMIVNSFEGMNRGQRRQFMKLMRQTTSGRALPNKQDAAVQEIAASEQEVSNGASTEDN